MPNPLGTKEQREEERQLLVYSNWTYRMKEEALDGLDIAEETWRALGHAIHLTEHNKAMCVRCREARKRIEKALAKWQAWKEEP